MTESLEWDNHACRYEEVEIGKDDADEDGPLRAGMKVLIPCTICGDEPQSYLEAMESHLSEAQAVLADFEPRRALFHWSPVARRKQILRYGLLPNRRSTTSEARAPFVCFGDSPSWSWALSGEMRYTPKGEWDLWQTSLDLLTDVTILPGERRSSGIYEVRTESRVYKRDLWWVGSRIKP